MRLILLPLTRTRTFIYCQHRPPRPPKHGGKKPAIQRSSSAPSPSLADRMASYASSKWIEWERSEPGSVKRTVTVYGNKALQRIPYEEWGLRSIPPLSSRKQKEIVSLKADSAKQDELEKRRIDVIFPSPAIGTLEQFGNGDWPVKGWGILQKREVTDVLKVLATERQGLHRTRLWGCLLGLPLTLPIALLPVIPNIPGFYLAYRAWSHWRALCGINHLDFIVDQNLVSPKPSSTLAAIYTLSASRTSALDVEREIKEFTSSASVSGDLKPDDAEQNLHDPASPKDENTKTELVQVKRQLSKGSDTADSDSNPDPDPDPDPDPAASQPRTDDRLLLDSSSTPLIAHALGVPELEDELERAIWQIERAQKQEPK